MSSSHSAIGPALGYLHQVRLALLLLLRADANSEMSIEKFDDVAFESSGTPVELIQSKHSIQLTPVLNDTSVDFWKTLKVWSDAIKNNSVNASHVVFSLITTAIADPTSAVSFLRVSPPNQRDESNALSRLVQIARDGGHATNQASYISFLSLSNDQRQSLFKNIRIIDQFPGIVDVRDEILKEIRLVTREGFHEKVFEMLEGWWINRIIQHLNGRASGTILFRELHSQINDIQEQFFKDNLPIHYTDPLDLAEEALSPDQKVFIEQLRLIQSANNRIKMAISDYYRAYHQRSKWVRDELLIVGDLESYELRLIDEWKRVFETMKEEILEGTLETDKVKLGRTLFSKIEMRNDLHIRPKCTDPFIMRGTYHILSNGLKVGWHIDFIERLNKIVRITAEVS